LSIVRQHRVLLALGALLVWVTLLQYLKYYARNFVLARTLSRGLPQLLTFFVGSIPVFLAFCFFAVVVFGDIDFRFDGTSRAALTMFCVGSLSFCGLWRWERHGDVLLHFSGFER
jgi:uncharacterized protein YybS (DUF2232 family)